MEAEKDTNAAADSLSGELIALASLTAEQQASLGQMNAALGAAAVLGHARFLHSLGVDPGVIQTVSTLLAARLEKDSSKGNNRLALGIIGFVTNLEPESLRSLTATPVVALPDKAKRDMPLLKPTAREHAVSDFFHQPDSQRLENLGNVPITREAVNLLTMYFGETSSEIFRDMRYAQATTFVDFMMWYFVSTHIIPEKEFDVRREEHRLYIVEGLSVAEIEQHTGRHSQTISNHFTQTGQALHRKMTASQTRKLLDGLVQKNRRAQSFTHEITNRDGNIFEFIERSGLPLPTSNAVETINQYFDIDDHPATYQLNVRQRERLAIILSDIFELLEFNRRQGKKDTDANERMRQQLYLRFVENMDWQEISYKLGYGHGKAASDRRLTQNRFSALFSRLRRRNIFMTIVNNSTSNIGSIESLLIPDLSSGFN